jgi:hypothetical protein
MAVWAGVGCWRAEHLDGHSEAGRRFDTVVTVGPDGVGSGTGVAGAVVAAVVGFRIVPDPDV